MGLITIVIIALALAMDAFAVSIVSGTTYRQLEVRHAFRMALFFGGFQAFMPLIGSLAGLTIRDYIAEYDHWVAFGLLAAVGGKLVKILFHGPAIRFSVRSTYCVTEAPPCQRISKPACRTIPVTARTEEPSVGWVSASSSEILARPSSSGSPVRPLIPLVLNASRPLASSHESGRPTALKR